MFAAAQESAKLAVGPEAGGYLCPDGRQLYVKSCYDASPLANCGIVNLHLPMRGGFQPETMDTRANITASVASCKVYPVSFRDGVVSLAVPKQQTAQTAPAARPAQVPAAKSAAPAPKPGAVAAADPTKLLRLSPKGLQPVTRYLLLESATPSPGVPNAIEFLTLTIFSDSEKESPDVRGFWLGYAVTCKQRSLRLVSSIAVDDRGAYGAVDAFDRLVPSAGELGQMADIACGAAPPAGPRLKSVAAAIADAATKPKPTPRGEIKLAVAVKAKVRLPETEAEKTFFKAVQTNRMQAAVNSTILPPGEKPVRIGELTDEQGMTAVHWATANRSLSALRWLLDKRPALNLADKRGRTPLRIALDNKHADAMRMLLDSGEDPNLVWPFHPDDLKGFKTSRELVDFMIEAGVPPSK